MASSALRRPQLAPASVWTRPEGRRCGWRIGPPLTRAADDDMRRVYTTLHVEMPAATNTLSRNVLALGSAAVRVWRQDEGESDGASSYAESSKGPSGNGSSITSTIASFKTAVGSSSGGVRSESSAHTDSQEEESVCVVLPHGLAIVVADDLRVNRFILSYHPPPSARARPSMSVPAARRYFNWPPIWPPWSARSVSISTASMNTWVMVSVVAGCSHGSGVRSGCRMELGLCSKMRPRECHRWCG